MFKTNNNKGNCGIFFGVDRALGLIQCATALLKNLNQKEGELCSLRLEMKDDSFQSSKIQESKCSKIKYVFKGLFLFLNQW